MICLHASACAIRIVFDRLPRLIHAAFVCGTLSPAFDVGHMAYRCTPAES